MTAERAKVAFDNAPEYAPEPPRPLRRVLAPSNPFPMDALGSILGPAALAMRDKTQAPEAMCGQSAFAGATLAVQAFADVLLPTGSVRPVSEFFATIGESGERKSAVDEIALWPVRKYEEALRADYDSQVEQQANELDAWKKQREQILADRKQYPNKEAKTQALADLGSAPAPPLVPILTCPEPTYEGLVRLLRQGYPSIGVFTAEGGQFVGSHAMSEENKLKTGSALSSLWDGEPVRRVRQGDGAFVLCGRRVAMHLMLQPGVAADLISDRVLRDQGTLSRLLVTYPDTTAGTRFWREPRPESDLAIRRYGARLLDALKTKPGLAPGKVNELAPRRLSLAPAARRLWVGLADTVEAQIGPAGSLEPVRGLANKVPEHAARLAGILALVENLDCGEIVAANMVAGVELAQHYLAEALRLYESGAANPELVSAERLLTWLTDAWEEAAVSLPDIYQLGPSAIRDGKTARRLIGVLEEHGWVRPIEGGAVVRGQKRRDAWSIIKGRRG